jgi:hypothetical protein
LASCDELKQRRGEADERHRAAAYAARRARDRGDEDEASRHLQTALGWYNRMREIEREMRRQGCK